MLIVARPTALGGSPAPSEGVDRIPISRIGPNAIIQVARVLRDRVGAPMADTILHEATGYTLGTLPTDMVPEQEALALSTAVMDRFGEARATRLLREAGERTGDYLLANRIPRPAQWLIRLAPERTGLSILLKAMLSHAWTFAGSGTFTVHHRPNGVELSFHACAMCRGMHTDGPTCDFYAGTFERLIRTLVSPAAGIHEVECHANGGRCCRFRITGLSGRTATPQAHAH